MTHLDQAEKQKISSKVWQDRGGGRGYGFVTRKVTKYLCRHRVKTIPQLSDVSTERGSVITTTNKSPNLSEPGCKDENILTGFMGILKVKLVWTWMDYYRERRKCGALQGIKT